MTLSERDTARIFIFGLFTVLVSLCGYVALYTYVVTQGFHFPALITFFTASPLSHLLPFVGGTLLTLCLAMGIIYLLNPLIKPKHHKNKEETNPLPNTLPNGMPPPQQTNSQRDRQEEEKHLNKGKKQDEDTQSPIKETRIDALLASLPREIALPPKTNSQHDHQEEARQNDEKLAKWWSKTTVALQNNQYMSHQIVHFLENGLHQLPPFYFSAVLENTTMWQYLAQPQSDVLPDRVYGVLLRCDPNQQTCLLNRLLQQQQQAGNYCCCLYTKLAQENVSLFPVVWKATRPYWQDQAKKNARSLSHLLSDPRYCDLLFSIVDTIKRDTRTPKKEREKQWLQCLTAVFGDEDQADSLLNEQAQKALLFTRYGLLRSAYLSRYDNHPDLITPLFNKKCIFKHWKENQIIGFLYQYRNKLHQNVLTGIYQTISNLKDTDKQARLHVTMLLSDHTLGTGRQETEEEKKPALLPPYAPLLQPIHYRITTSNRQRSKVDTIEAYIQAMSDMHNKEVTNEDKEKFSTGKMPIFFANLINASKHNMQIASIQTVIANYIEKQGLDKKIAAKFITDMLQQVDFASLARCKQPSMSGRIVKALIDLAKPYQLTPEQDQACWLRPSPENTTRPKGECLLDMLGVREEDPHEQANHVIKNILTPLHDFALIHALLKERDLLSTLLSQEQQGASVFNLQCHALGKLLAYYIDCLKKTDLKKAERVNQVIALIGKQFLSTLKDKIDNSTLIETHKLAIWQQYLHCMDEKLALLDLCYPDKAGLIAALYKTKPSFRPNEEQYQTILDPYRCCIKLNQLINESQAAVQAFKQAAKGTLYDIYHALSTYCDCLWQQTHEAQTQWLCDLLGAKHPNALSQRLSQRLHHSHDKKLRHKLLQLLFELKKTASIVSEQEEKSPSPRTYLEDETVQALLLGKNNIYTPPPLPTRSELDCFDLMDDFQVLWEATKPRLSQQRLFPSMLPSGATLLAQWLAWGAKHPCKDLSLSEEKSMGFYRQMHAVLACIFATDQHELFIASASTALSAIFSQEDSLKNPFNSVISIPLLTHLLPLITHSHTTTHTIHKTGPKWLAPDFLVTWLKQPLKIIDPPWEKLIMTMANCCPALLLSQLKDTSGGLSPSVMKWGYGSDGEFYYFKPIVRALLRLSQLKNALSVSKTARTMLLQQETSSCLYQILFEEAAWEHKQRTAIWQDFIEGSPADCLFHPLTCSLPQLSLARSESAFQNAVNQLITIFDTSFFEKETFGREPKKQIENAGCFLTNLCHFIPQLEGGIKVLCDSLVQQLIKIKKQSLANRVLNALIVQLSDENQAKHGMKKLIQPARTYLDNHMKKYELAYDSEVHTSLFNRHTSRHSDSTHPPTSPTHSDTDTSII